MFDPYFHQYIILKTLKTLPKTIINAELTKWPPNQPSTKQATSNMKFAKNKNDLI